MSRMSTNFKRRNRPFIPKFNLKSSSVSKNPALIIRHAHACLCVLEAIFVHCMCPANYIIDETAPLFD